MRHRTLTHALARCQPLHDYSGCTISMLHVAGLWASHAHLGADDCLLHLLQLHVLLLHHLLLQLHQPFVIKLSCLLCFTPPLPLLAACN